MTWALSTEEVREMYVLAADTSNDDRDNGEDFDFWLHSEIEKAERRSRTDFADELTRKGVYSFDIHSIRRYAGENHRKQ